MLGNRAPEKGITSVVGVSTLGWFVFKSALVMLAAKNCVTLDCMLVTKPITVDVAFAFHRNIKQLKGCTLPEIIAAVYQFINAAIKSSLCGYLSLDEPI